MTLSPRGKNIWGIFVKFKSGPPYDAATLAVLTDEEAEDLKMQLSHAKGIGEGDLVGFQVNFLHYGTEVLRSTASLAGWLNRYNLPAPRGFVKS